MDIYLFNVSHFLRAKQVLGSEYLIPNLVLPLLKSIAFGLSPYLKASHPETNHTRAIFLFMR